MELNLKELRKARGLSQDDMAHALGIKKPRYGTWERGERMISLEQACTVADIFECSLDQLVRRKTPAGGLEPFKYQPHRRVKKMDLQLKSIRKSAGIRQTDLSKTIGVDIKTIGNWERGSSFPNAAQIWDCAVALNCTPNEILGWDDGIAKTVSPNQQLLNEYYEAMTEEDKETLLRVAKSISKKGR